MAKRYNNTLQVGTLSCIYIQSLILNNNHINNHLHYMQQALHRLGVCYN